MSETSCIRGDATAPSAKGVKVIAHVRNNIGGWGKGFVRALSRRRPEPEAAYRAWHRDRASNDVGLGVVQVVPVDRYVWVANMIGRRGIRRGSKGVPVCYDAIDTALDQLADRAVELGAPCRCPAWAAGSPGAAGCGSSR